MRIFRTMMYHLLIEYMKDKVLVQVVKEAIDTKGPKLTANIEFTGNMSFICHMMNACGFSENKTIKKTTTTPN